MAGMISLILAAALLPLRLDPPAPFPHVLEQAPTVETIAPGVEYGEYQLQTDSGPLAIHVVGIETRRTDVHVGSVLAGDALVSHGETIGSMAQRTRAVAGINADFFDIGNTNRPINMVVLGGALLQLPYKRYVLAIERDGTPHIAEFTFSGEVEVGGRTLPLDAIDEMPHSDSGVSLLTPLYGRVPARDTITLATLQLLEGTPPLARYRVTGTADNTVAQPPGYYLAAGANENIVDAGGTDAVANVTGDLSPIALNDITSAVGGGALILHDGRWYDDSDAPYRVENARRMPCSGAAIASDGRLYFVEVDGRQPDLSVGTTRPQFAALMRAFGATEGLLLDGGGSSTLVARRLGDRAADLTNAPSDGKERPVADGLFVYSTAPVGPPVRLIARPNVIRTVPGADIPLRVAAVDAFYHASESAGPVDATVTPSNLGAVRDGVFRAAHAGTGRLILHDNGLHGDVPLEVDAGPARTRILPGRPNVREHQTVALTAQAYDARGFALTLPSLLPWEASDGTIDQRGIFRAGTNDANVSVRLGNAIATTRVTVGEHDVALPFVQYAHFVTLPHDGPGALSKNDGCDSCLGLRFSFAANERAAYAMGNVPLPDDTIGIKFDLHDDGSAARVRLSFRNEINEDVLLDATELGENGWRSVVVRFPAGARAARLEAIYVLPAKGIELSEGEIVLRNVRAIVAGH